jgi:hypothetical protein
VGGYPQALVIAVRQAAELPHGGYDVAQRIERELRPAYELLWQHLTHAERDLLRACVESAVVLPQDSDGRACLQALARKGLLIATEDTAYRLASWAWARFVTALVDS